MKPLKILILATLVLTLGSCTKETLQNEKVETEISGNEIAASGWGLNNMLVVRYVAGELYYICIRVKVNCFDEIVVAPFVVSDDLLDGGNINNPDFYIRYLEENFVNYYDNKAVLDRILELVEAGELIPELGSESPDPLSTKILMFKDPNSTDPENVHTAFQFKIERGSIAGE